jgi:hypothetical protein
MPVRACHVQEHINKRRRSTHVREWGYLGTFYGVSEYSKHAQGEDKPKNTKPHRVYDVGSKAKWTLRTTWGECVLIVYF